MNPSQGTSIQPLTNQADQHSSTAGVGDDDVVAVETALLRAE